MDIIECREWDRINLVVGRDGVPAALAFAEQGVGQYQSAIREADSRGHGYGAAYRENLLVSIRVYWQFLEQKQSLGKRPEAV